MCLKEDKMIIVYGGISKAYFFLVPNGPTIHTDLYYDQINCKYVLAANSKTLWLFENIRKVSVYPQKKYENSQISRKIEKFVIDTLCA